MREKGEEKAKEEEYNYVWRRRRSLGTIIRKIVSVGVAVLKKGRKVMA
jgi:hypothetical protein